jgi:hypothetical protein
VALGREVIKEQSVVVFRQISFADGRESIQGFESMNLVAVNGCRVLRFPYGYRASVASIELIPSVIERHIFLRSMLRFCAKAV